MESIPQRFGKRVREERLKRGYSQEDFAERADIHRTFVGMIERGEKASTIVTVEKLAHALEMEISELLKGI